MSGRSTIKNLVVAVIIGTHNLYSSYPERNAELIQSSISLSVRSTIELVELCTSKTKSGQGSFTWTFVT